MEKKIIINAYDFGLSRAYNLGVIDALKASVISSTTLLITSNACDHAIHLAKDNPNLDWDCIWH